MRFLRELLLDAELENMQVVAGSIREHDRRDMFKSEPQFNLRSATSVALEHDFKVEITYDS